MKTNIVIALFFLFSCSYKSSQTNVYELKNIIRIESILVANDMDSSAAINNEEFFDTIDGIHKKIVNKNMSSTSISLGYMLNEVNKIDIRSKVFITYKNGSIEKLFLDFKGRVLYKGNVYSGSKDLVTFLRCGVLNYDSMLYNEETK